MRGLRLLGYSFAVLGLLLSGRPVLAEETIKLAYTDPFSGPFASGGDEFLKNFQFIIARKNAKGGALGTQVRADPVRRQAAAGRSADRAEEHDRPEHSVRDALHRLQCRRGADRRGVKAQRPQSRQPHPLSQLRGARDRAHQRAVRLLAFPLRRAASTCAPWRASSRCRKELKKVYLLNQDYLFGQSIQKDTKKWLAQLAPISRSSADELMPFGKVQDFCALCHEDQGVGRAERCVTGNYNRDLNLLIKAAVDAGLNVRFDTFLSHLIGRPHRDRRGRRRSANLDHGLQRQRSGRDLKVPDAEKFVKEWRTSGHDIDVLGCSTSSP